jgi:hypothetical protein
MIYKTLLMVFLTIATLILPTYFFWYKPKFKISKTRSFKKYPENNSAVYSALKEKAGEANKFLLDKKFNTEICFLIDMNIESGRNRFFVYDIKKDSVLFSGLVAHGSCDETFRTTPNFSNKINSGCSSMGKYKIGGAYTGKFGLSYKLYGLDSSNNNAFQRFVVLHEYGCVPEQETYPIPICNSRGCPMVSPGFMNQLRVIIKSSSKPILLWIFQ